MTGFSDKPLEVDGVEIKPRWPWSDQYRCDVREHIRAASRSDRSPDERAEDYVRWYAKKHRISIKKARKRLQADGRLVTP